GFVYFEGSHNGYERLEDPVTHTRSILFMKQSGDRKILPIVVVRDRFNARERHHYALRYHFGPGCSALACGNTVGASADGRAIGVSVFAQGDLKSSIEEGWVSRCYGRRELAPVALFEADGVGPQEFVTLIAPCKGGLGAQASCLQAQAAIEAGRMPALSGGQIEITIHPADEFDLSSSDPPKGILINKSKLTVEDSN